MSFEIVRSKDKAKDAAELYKQQYCNGGTWTTFNSKHWPVQPEEIYRRAVAAQGNARKLLTILNGSWIKTLCRECVNYVDVAVEIQMDYESGATVCVPCLAKILRSAKDSL